MLIFRNPNGVSRALHQIGWPKYAPVSKHVLQISTFADQNIDYESDGDSIFTAIIHENKAENCAFWNKLLPSLIQISDDQCRNSQDSKKYLPLSSRDLSSTTPEPTIPLKLMPLNQGIIDLIFLLIDLGPLFYIISKNQP